MPHKKLAALALLAVLGLFLQPRPAIAGDLTGRASVIDGDTIEIHTERIRLEGVDAPESGQSCTDAEGHAWPCGQRAAFALAEDLTGRASVIDGDTIEIHGTRIRLEGVDAPESGQSCTDTEGRA